MSDFGSGLEQCGPMHELSGRASKADLRRRIATLEAEKAHGAACYSDMEEAKRLVSIERDIAQTALALLETSLPNDVEHAVTLAEESFPSDQVGETCGLCIHFLSAFDTCAIGPVETCFRWMPGMTCRLTPTEFRKK